MRKVVDVNELIRRRDELLEELRTTPKKDKDYTEYRKITMKIKYNTNEEERKRSIDKANKRIKDIYSNEEERKKYADYQLKLFHIRKGVL